MDLIRVYIQILGSMVAITNIGMDNYDVLIPFSDACGYKHGEREPNRDDAEAADCDAAARLQDCTNARRRWRALQ